MGMECDPHFFRRKPEAVADELIGSYVMRDVQGNRIDIGILAAIDVLIQPDMRDSRIYRALPGTLVRYASSKGFCLGISSHEPGAGGIITLLRVKCDGETLEPEEVYSALGGDRLDGKLVGRESGLYITPDKDRAFALDTGIPANSPVNRSAYRELQIR